MGQDTDTLKKTPLYNLHVELGGKIVPFAGYEMPVSFPMGVMKEHLHTRSKAGLFDVSHMGQAGLSATSGLAEALETLVPGNIKILKPGKMRYTQFTTPAGGIIDDLMVTRLADQDGNERLFLVVNGARKEIDFAHLRTKLPDSITFTPYPDRALLALQGPKAAECLSVLFPECQEMGFMTMSELSHERFGDVMISRSGYTGEDGYEISVAADKADEFARTLLDQADVEMIGLGARDSLRLEAGLCLYGHDIDETTTPVQADLVWSIGKRRKEEGGFPGADVVQAEIKNGTARKRVGILPQGKAPAREHTQIMSKDGLPIGEITSGGYGPTAQTPVAMGYVKTEYAEIGSELMLLIRGKQHPAKVAALPFAPHNYYRAKK